MPVPCIVRARHVERLESDALLVVSLDRLLPALRAGSDRTDALIQATQGRRRRPWLAIWPA